MSLTRFFLECEMFQTKPVEKTKHTFYVQCLFIFANRAVYEKMWKNIVEPGGHR